MKNKINRLAKAATISDIRMTMNIEDEIYSELENLDTKILSQKKPWLKKINSWLIRKSSWPNKDLLRNTIKMLLESGKTPYEIAEKLNLDIDAVNELM